MSSIGMKKNEEKCMSICKKGMIIIVIIHNWNQLICRNDYLVNYLFI